MVFNKILIIRFSSIGDVVLTTPIVRCIKRQLNAEIHFLIKQGYAHVIHENPYIDQIHHLKEDLNETISVLKNEAFDLVIDLQKNFRSFRICTALGCKTIRFDKMNVRKWMAVNLKINRLPTDKHLVDRYFDALKEISIHDDGQGLDYFIMPEDEYDAQGLVSGINYQVLILGATYFTKRIPREKCEEIIAITDKHTVLLGGADVSGLANELAMLFPQKVVNFCGKIGLGVSAGMVKHAKNIITSDTGLMHIAAALQKEVTVLWGNTIPEFGMYPYYGFKNHDKHLDLQVQNLTCRPCSKLGFERCPKGHFRCMLDIAII